MLLLLAACYPDDWNGQPYHGWDGTTVPSPSDTSVETSGGDGLVGRWVSQGADISSLFRDPPFSYVEVDAQFEASGDYAVTVKNSDGDEAPASGTWTDDGSTEPATIALTQTEPYDAVASGIYQVDGDVLKYEVVQTTPDYGFLPPTPQSGFGSTAGPGIAAGVNVQTFRRTP